jgi:ABC-type nickel/cobalt efflux system permease component RcnA
MTTAVHRSRVTGAPVDLRRESDVDDMALRAIMRANLRLSLGYASSMVVALAAAVLAFRYVPFLSTRSFLAFPLSWWLLGGASFVLIGFAALRYVRAVERLEQRFVALTDPRTKQA